MTDAGQVSAPTESQITETIKDGVKDKIYWSESDVETTHVGAGVLHWGFVEDPLAGKCRVITEDTDEHGENTEDRPM